jgi:hypothetical protein
MIHYIGFQISFSGLSHIVTVCPFVCVVAHSASIVIRKRRDTKERFFDLHRAIMQTSAKAVLFTWFLRSLDNSDYKPAS